MTGFMIQSRAPMLPTSTATHTAYLLPLVLLILGNSASRADAAFDNPSVCKNPSMFTPDKKLEVFSGRTCKAYMDTYFERSQFSFKKLNAEVCASMEDSSRSTFAQFGGLCCSDTHYACNPLPSSAICAKPSDFNSSSLDCSVYLTSSMKDVTEFSLSTCRRTGSSDTPMAMQMDNYYGAACCSGAKSACDVANNQDVNGNSRLRIHELIRLSLVVAFFATKF
jgi:hypothetical protein